MNTTRSLVRRGCPRQSTRDAPTATPALHTRLPFRHQQPSRRPSLHLNINPTLSCISCLPARLPTASCSPPRPPAPSSQSNPAVRGRAVHAATATAAGPAAGPLPYSAQARRAVRASREQAALQGLMFAGPDQLLLGVLAVSPTAPGASPSGAGSQAAAVLEAALGGGDVASVREWLNEQAGQVAPLVSSAGGGAVSTSRLLASDVEFTAAARQVLRLAGEGAEAMGSRCIGTYHLLLVLIQGNSRPAASSRPEQGKRQGQSQWLGQEGGQREDAEGATTTAADSAGAAGGRSGAGQPQPPVVGLLPALLRVAEVDVPKLRDQLLALAEQDVEDPPAVDAAAAYQDLVSNLVSTYQKLAAQGPNESWSDAAFRLPPPGLQQESPQQPGDQDLHDIYE